VSSKPTSTEPTWLVDVAVPVPLRQTFSYRLPKKLDPDLVRQGYRVLVPFGPRLLHGITMSDAYACEEPEHKLRTLVKLDTTHQILSVEIRELLEWMAKYYRSPIGEMVKMALPPGILGKPNLCFRLTPKGIRHVEDAASDRRLGLLHHRPLTRKAWEVKAQAKIPFRQIRDWEDKGYLEILNEIPQKDAIPHTTVLTLTEAGSASDLQALKRAPKQRQIVAWLRARDQPSVSRKDLNSAFPNAASAIKALVDRGLVIQKEVPTHQLSMQTSATERATSIQLNPEQVAAFDAIHAAIESKTFKPFLLFGVTGSGKTEIYLRAISKCLEQGRQALFLVPEIALTPLMQKRIVERFGDRLAILHSAVGQTQRSKAWSKVLAGKVEVVLGARSGIFAPLPNLGLLIVDEEHDTSYKQQDGVRYHARDLALVRAQKAGATIILGSATPSLESWHNQERGRFDLLTLNRRATNAPLPAVTIVDMREEFKALRKRALFSRELLQRLRTSLDRGQQAMILLNRRGYHSFLLCRKCGQCATCSQCEVALTYHRTDGRLKCHYCEETRPVPNDCAHCGSPAAMMQFFGEGTQQVQEALAKVFPDTVIDRLDRDRLTRKEAHRNILQKFELGQTQILVGTQMIAKGHDFPNVTTVGIINADQGLRMPDFRAAEHVFQLITQVAGRSGRGDSPGSVVIQTYMPEHYSVQCAADHDFSAFLKKEMRYRRHLFYPPFSYAVHILVQDKQAERGWQAIQWMVSRLKSHKEAEALVILGPTKAPIGKIKEIFRFQLLVKSPNRGLLHRLCDQVIESAIARNLISRTGVILDIDPYQFS